MKIHHIGYAVKGIEKAKETFQVLGYEAEGEVVFDKERNVNILFMVNEDYRIELVAPGEPSEPSPVDSWLKIKKGGLPYHICYEVSDMEREIERMKKEKFILAEQPKEAPAIGGCKVAFLYKGAVGLIELVEM